ncbi:MAG: DUF481 domain-containing protein [Planctomycetaceae bacterium]
MTAGLFRTATRLTAFLAVALMVCAGGRAGENGDLSEILVLTNGDRVSGVSVGMTDGSLRWRMPYGGELLIPISLVDRIEEASADLTVVTPAERPAKEPAATDAEPSESKAKGESKSDPKVQPASAETPPVVSDPPPLTRAWYDAMRSTYSYAGTQTGSWTKRFEFGGTWVDGNSETSEVYIGGIFERQFEKVFHQFEWNGRHATAGEKVTQSRWQINGNTDFGKDKKAKWILFSTHRHLFDELAELDYRGTFASGVGYRFYNEKEKRLIFRLGPGATVEKYGEPLGTRVTPDLFAEAEAKWPVFDRTQLEYKSTLTPSLADMGVFRATTNYGVLVKLDSREAWAMRLGLRHEYNSQPNSGTKENDFTTMFSVVYLRDKPKK